MIKYEKPEDLRIEKLIADAFGSFVKYTRWEKYKADEVFAVPDYVFYNGDQLEVGAEIKRRETDFGYYESYMISADKLVAMRCFKKAECVLVIGFNDYLAILFPEKTPPYKYSDKGEHGRGDRGNPADKGIMAFFRWKDLTKMFLRRELY